MNLPGMEPLWRAAVVDPPWEHHGGGGRGAQYHYPTLPTHRMPGVILGSGMWRPHEHAHLYLWVTGERLLNGEAAWLTRQLGFRPISVVTWGKRQSGTGRYFRGRAEFIAFGVRGRGLHPSVCTERKDLDSLLLAGHVRKAKGTRIHSAKPPESYALVEARSHGPYAEFFARGSGRPGWLVWGNEAVQQETP